MKVVSANCSENTVEFEQWKIVCRVMDDHLHDMWVRCDRLGYEGLFDVVPKYFGMTRMYRHTDLFVTYEFTDEQWTMFVLRWA